MTAANGFHLFQKILFSFGCFKQFKSPVVINFLVQENPYLSFPRSQFGSNFHQPVRVSICIIVSCKPIGSNPNWNDFKHYQQAAVEMASGKPTLESVERALNNWLRPQLLGESWDNIGLLVGSGKYEKNEKSISSIILCNDLMPRVLDEAISKNADMILAYHPPIFTGMKSVAYGNWKVISHSNSIRMSFYTMFVDFYCRNALLLDAWLTTSPSTVLIRRSIVLSME